MLLEGPQPISEVAFVIGHAIREWGAVLEALVEAALGDEADRDEEDAAERAVGEAAGEVVGTFIDMARQHLDHA